MAQEQTYECDVLVIGSGASGMAAAVTAASHGLKVLIAEKEPRFGGTTARSGGWLWIPGTSLAKSWGINETPDLARTYLQHEAGCQLRSRASRRIHRKRTESRRLFRIQDGSSLRHADGVSRLPRGGARRHARRPVDGCASIRWPRARRTHQDARTRAAGIDRLRNDAWIRQGDRSLHARDPVARVGLVCHQASDEALSAGLALRARNDPHERQCAGRSPRQVRVRSWRSAMAIVASEQNWSLQTARYAERL